MLKIQGAFCAPSNGCGALGRVSKAFMAVDKRSFK